MNNRNKDKTKIKAVILVGSRGFSQCRLANSLPMALWQLKGKSAVENLLVSLCKQGIKRAVICSNGDRSLLERSIHIDRQMEVDFLYEPLPVGPAGCIRQAANKSEDSLLLVFNGSMMSPPHVDWMIKAHSKGNSELTVIFNPSPGVQASQNSNSRGKAAEIYVCETSVLEHIPEEGYFDIKEELIPEILSAGKTVYAAVSPHDVGNYRNREEYLAAVDEYFEELVRWDKKLKLTAKGNSRALWTAADCRINPTAKIHGPVIIMDGAHICKNAVIIGPSVINRDVVVGEDCIVVNSVLWDRAKLAHNCLLQQCILDYDVTLRPNTVIENSSIAHKPGGVLTSLFANISTFATNSMNKLISIFETQLDKLDDMLPVSLRTSKTVVGSYLAVIIILTAFLWSYWPIITNVWDIWLRSDEYSSGLLVPFLALYILWSRRHKIEGIRIYPCIWGLLVFLFAQTVGIFGLFFMYGSAERFSIVLSIAALVLFILGWQFFKKVSTVLLFLCLMLPWPNRVQEMVTQPLQRWATSSAVFSLELIGYEVVREGNIIHIGDTTVAVAEACNGLRMITAFFIIIGLVVLLIKRSWWEKILIFGSCLPIALLCNTIRLVITSVAFTVLEGQHWESIFHDFGGYAMMPLALAVAMAELWLLTKLTVPPDKKVQKLQVYKRILRNA